MSKIRKLVLTVAVLLAVAGCLGSPAQIPRSEALKNLARQSLARIDGELKVPGMRQPVEVIRDT
jgi:hypothetical protein